MRFLANARNDRTFGETNGKERWFASGEFLGVPPAPTHLSFPLDYKIPCHSECSHAWRDEMRNLW
jgi:hypothetical protein